MTGNEERKVGILAEAARYDASCSTAGSARKNAGGVGNGAIGGICHAWSDDGRCVALLKVLFSNACAYDCAYCANRRSNDVPRATFAVEELARVAMEFYKRNYIEGLFLSSGVLGTPEATMERLIAVARRLRLALGYQGYIHMKAIPGCSDAALMEAARWADRISVNIELPSSASLARLAPDKSPAAIFGPMRSLARARRGLALPGGRPSLARGTGPAAASVGAGTASAGTELSGATGADTTGGDAPYAETPAARGSTPPARAAEEYFMPAGQTTQLVVGASPESDRTILGLAENLYRAYDMRRVYYSAYIPINDDPRLPSDLVPPLLREHRLYQADWLFRFYHFKADEIVDESRPFLESDIDPKASWAVRHLERFPVDPNRADYEELLRVPGLGPNSAKRILRARRGSTLKEAELRGLGVVMKRARFFLTWPGKERSRELAPERLRACLLDGALAGGQLEFGWGPPSTLVAEAEAGYAETAPVQVLPVRASLPSPRTEHGVADARVVDSGAAKAEVAAAGVASAACMKASA